MAQAADSISACLEIWIVLEAGVGYMRGCREYKPLQAMLAIHARSMGQAEVFKILPVQGLSDFLGKN